ncbi:MAG TPA: ATP-dependent zinc metalloprotease FtsH [Thermomicrobiales bacterium]|nr:ATP-dependent zinc metalloprotease FtsH [Thermomicrobiales bacterium]
MPNRKWLRNGFVWAGLILVLLVAWFFYSDRKADLPSVDFNSTVIADIKAGKVDRLVTTEGSDTVEVHYKDSDTPTSESRLPPNTNVVEVLTGSGLEANAAPVEVKPASNVGPILGALVFLLPSLLIVGLIVLMMRQSQGSNSQAMSFGKSKARLFSSNRPTVTFSDVAGVDEAKEELAEVVEFLKYPDKFASLGARIPRGVLLVGPPGTGKTLLSRAVAGEAGVPFFSISGSEFVEMFVGVGASRVRDLFEQAKRNAPCIIFIDEIDAVGRQRGAGLGGSHDEREQTLNQILVEMDGFDSSTNVIVIAATNRPDVLDPALLRPGRFDRQVILDRPDIQGRRQILNVHMRGKPIEENVSVEGLARQTSGFSGADLENLVNEAAILAARRNKKTVGRNEITEAIDRVIAGPQRKSRVISERERLMTAYHEAGHALVARMLPNADPVRKVSIVARGMAGGYTRTVPDEDRIFKTKAQFEDDIAVFMAGQVAEQMVFEEISTGASNDIERATGIARRMVTEFGMSELGPLAYGKKDELVFLGRDINEQRNYSDPVAFQIDGEVHKIIEIAHERATTIIREHFDRLDAIAQLLIREETIDDDQLEALFDAPRPKPDLVGPPYGRPSARAQEVASARRQVPVQPAIPDRSDPRAKDRKDGDPPAGRGFWPQPVG